MVGKKEISSFNSEEQTSPNSYPFAPVLFMNLPNSLQFFLHTATSLQNKNKRLSNCLNYKGHMCHGHGPLQVLPLSRKATAAAAQCCRDGLRRSWAWAQLEWIPAPQGWVTVNSAKPLGASMLEEYQAWIALLLCCGQHGFLCRY